MTPAQLAAILGTSSEYVLYLYSILNGMEANFPDEDLEDALAFEELLNALAFEDE